MATPEMPQELQLTEDESTALQAFKESLSTTDAEAAQSLSDSDFLRFLRSRDFNEEKSMKLLVQHLKWRRSFVPLGYIKEEEVATELARKQVMLMGHDKYGCSVLVLLMARHQPYARDFEEIKRLFVYAFDKAAASNLKAQTKFMVIADLEGWGLKNFDIRGWLAVLEILQNQYPERLRKLFLLHLPYVFWGAWKIVYPFIDKNTREKVVFVENKHLKETLTEEVEINQLPKLYGGEQDLIPIQEYVTPNWPSHSLA